MIKACIFDMDGTLVNSLDSIAYFANKALKEEGLSPINTQTYKYLVGNGAKNLVKGMLKTVGADESLFDRVFPNYSSSYHENFLYLTEPYEGIMEMLKELKNKGIVTAILSNKPHDTTIKISDALFSNNLIDLCCGAIDGIKLKPDPSGVFNIIEQLNLKKEDCIYIGDTSTDMITGKKAGLYTVGVLWGFRERRELEENGADAIISSPAELISIINSTEWKS